MEQLNEFEGVELIYRYLLCIRMEQKFLKQFPEEYIREVLVRYHSDYEELFLNLCGLLLRKILVNMLIGAKLEKIKLETTDYEKLKELVNSISKEELLAFMRKQYDEVCYGDLEYLGSTSLERFARAIRLGYHNQLQKRIRDEYSMRDTEDEYGTLSEETRWDDEVYRMKLEDLF